MAVGAYPGTFSPPTVAHLAVADAARRQGGLDRIDLIVSQVALGKEDLAVPTLTHRLQVLEEVAASRPWLGVRVTTSQLIVDVAVGYDAVVLGADKWAQVVDPGWYEDSERGRDAAVARLPRVLVAPRPPFPVPPDSPRVVVLNVDASHAGVSATAARAGRHEWMLPEAAAFDLRTGAWSDPGRYPKPTRRVSEETAE
jgi:hypothetical protein